MQPKIFLLSSGTRGDVQPYVALSNGLQHAGLPPVVVTHPSFAGAVAGAGLPFASLGENPTDLMTRPGDMPLTFSGRPFASLRATLAYLQDARPLYRQMFQHAQDACQNAAALVVGLPTFWAESLAEALHIPLIWAPLQPLTPTGAFASAMLPFRLSLGRPFNRLSHQLVLRLTRTAWLGEINAWRRTDLNLLPLSWLSPMPGSPSRSIPHVYGISQHVLPRPTDWPANHHLSGFWFTPPPDHYQPPPDLLRFLDAGEPPVYIGFGSMAQTDQTITDLLEACRTSGRRIVAGLLPSAIAAHLPENLFLVQDIPHAWLFPHMQAAIHHGGAGTTAASLRAGLPTAIAPVGIDQFFWGERVWRLGAGPKPTPQRILNAVRIAELVEDVASPAYRAHSARLGALLGAEDGVAQAAALIKAAVL